MEGDDDMTAMAVEPETMRAAVRERYGAPREIVEFKQVPKPTLEDDQVLVRVRATSINRSDYYTAAAPMLLLRKMVGGAFRKPKTFALGGDFAGVVEAVGAARDDFRPGDEVFGARTGAFAELVCARAALAPKPEHVTFEEAAAVPVAGLTALQGLRDRGGLQPGQRVLVNGASGGVGTFAVQIAKALGGEVTAVCSTRNVERAQTLGADRVIDYTRDDFTRTGDRYDLIFDNAGSRSWRECARILRPDGAVVLVGGPMGSRLLGPMGHIAAVKLASLPSKRTTRFFVATFTKADMQVLHDLLDGRKLTPVIDRRYALSETAEALRYMGEGHARGKIAIAI
jgi:NADPH:quinone reductase-like Zn-dependent oxidoreductase